MNKFLFGLLSLVLLIASCDKRDDVQKGTVIFSANIVASDNGRIAEDQVSAVIISLEDADGKIVLDNKEYAVNGFQSDPILLEIGAYEVTKFLLMNDLGEVIYATPKEGSVLGTLVNNPLPVEFSIASDEVNNLSLEVISTSSVDPEDLGYTALGFDIVPTTQILVSALSQNGESTSFALADLTVFADGDSLYTKELGDSINVITLRTDFTSIDLKLTLGDTLTELRTLTGADLVTYRTVPLTVVFDVTAGSVMIIRPGPDNGKDALLSKILPDNNYGDYEDIHMYTWTVSGAFETHHVLIDFDLSDLPEGAVIDAAYLSFYYNTTSVYQIVYHPHNSGDNTFSINRVMEGWDESTVTWNTKPQFSEDGQIVVENRPGDVVDYDNIDITQLVKDKYEDPSSNHGFLLKHVNESVYKVAFFASSNHPNESLRPSLEIHYH